MNPIQKKISVFPIFLGIALASGSVAALANDHPIGGGILGLLAAGAVYMAFNTDAVAVCPSCSKSFKITPGGTFIQCPHCLEWCQVENRATKQLPQDFVADKPVFEIRMRTLSESGHGLPNGTVWPNPSQCCVCGTALSARPTLTITRETMVGAPYAGRVQVKVETYEVQPPCCMKHPNGVEWSISGAFEPKQVSILKFRSYPYSRAFRTKNGDVIAPPGWGGEGS